MNRFIFIPIILSLLGCKRPEVMMGMSDTLAMRVNTSNANFKKISPTVFEVAKGHNAEFRSSLEGGRDSIMCELEEGDRLELATNEVHIKDDEFLMTLSKRVYDECYLIKGYVTIVIEGTAEQALVDLSRSIVKGLKNVTNDFKLAFGRWRPEWTVVVAESIKEINPGLVSDEVFAYHPKFKTDMVALCPNYVKMDAEGRTKAIALFMASMTEVESGFEPKTVANEPGKSWKSNGLLQLTPANDGPNGPECREIQKNPSLVFDPIANLRCGMRIFNNQIKKWGTLYPKSKGYWGPTMRENHPKYKGREDIRAYYLKHRGSIGCT